MDAISSFRTRLREALERKGMSQTELARQLGVRVATVNEWLNRGTMPSGPIMLRLPGILGLDGHWLLTGEQRVAGGGERLTDLRRDRLASLLEDALLVLRTPEHTVVDTEALKDLVRVRRPREDELRALEAVERHRREQVVRSRARRKSG